MERLVDRKTGCTKFWCSLFYGALPALFYNNFFTENGTIEVLISEKQMSKRRQVV